MAVASFAGLELVKVYFFRKGNWQRPKHLDSFVENQGKNE